MKNKGFTLIEILIAVLIIGILAAIAVPQYQKGVEKSKALQGLTLLKSVIEAINVYYLANGVYPSSFDKLDISIPTSFNGTQRFIMNTGFALSNKDWSLDLENGSGYVTLFMGRISGKYKGAGFMFSFQSPNNTHSKDILCFERKSYAYYIFDKKLSEGSYCKKNIQAKFHSENLYARKYSL